MKKMIFIVIILLTPIYFGCNSSKLLTKSELPRKAIKYLETLGQNDNIASYKYNKEFWDKHSPHAIGFFRPNQCWTVETKDSTTICFSKKGNWLYSVTNTACLNSKYLANIDNIDKMILHLQKVDSQLIEKGSILHIVGVSKEKDTWIIKTFQTPKSEVEENYKTMNIELPDTVSGIEGEYWNYYFNHDGTAVQHHKTCRILI